MNRERAYVQLITKLLGVEFDSLWHRHRRLLIRRMVAWAVGFVSVLSALSFVWVSNRPVDVAVRLLEVGGENTLLSRAEDAVVTLTVGGETKTDTVPSLGDAARFLHIPHRFLGKEVKMTVECRNYMRADTLVVLGRTMTLALRRDPNVYGSVHFTLWDMSREVPVPNTVVYIEGMEAQSKIRQTLQEQLRKKEEELEALRRQQKITQEQFRKQRQELYAAQKKDEKLIAEMAERYSTLDFDQMDEFQRRVATFIQNGELARADSLLNTKGSMEERSKELDRMNEAIKADAEDLAKRQEAHDKSVALKDKTLKDFAADCHSRYEMCLLEHKNDSAAYWLELRAAKDTMNVEWQLWAGNTIEVFLANYKQAFAYYQRALNVALMQYGERHPYVPVCYNKIGILCDNLGNYSLALECFQKSLNGIIELYGENNADAGTRYHNIASIYGFLGDYASAQKYEQKALEIDLNVSGENHPDVALVYENMGDEYEKQEDLTSALECYQKALKINLNVWGENHPDVSKGYNNVGHVSSALGDYATALECYKRNLTILAMDNGVFYQHHFENKTGLFFDMKEVGAEEKQRIIKAYHQWKKENKENKQNDSL